MKAMQLDYFQTSVSSSGLSPSRLCWIWISSLFFLDDKSKFLITEIQPRCSNLCLLHSPHPFFPAGWTVSSRTVFLISHCLVSLCGVYVCLLHSRCRTRINSLGGSVQVLVLPCFFSNIAFQLYCHIKGRKPQITIWMVGKDSSHSGSAFGRLAWKLHTGEKRVKDCNLNRAWNNSSRSPSTPAPPVQLRL